MSEATKEWSESTKTGLYLLAFLLPLIGFLAGLIGLFSGNSGTGVKLLILSTCFWIFWTVVLGFFGLLLI